MQKFFLSMIAVALFAAIPAQAEGIRYYEDPIFKKLNADDHHPMEDMLNLAEEGDVRAQFILADLYAKGKGGFPRNDKKARYWFEASAYNGFPFSFIRLAALEKRLGHPAAAYKWYTLAVDNLRGPSRNWAQKAREELLKTEKLGEEDLSRARQEARAWRENKSAEAREKQQETEQKIIEKGEKKDG